MPHTVVLIIFAMLYITFLVLIYLVAEICIFRLSSSDSLSPPPTSDLFFFECVRVLVCFWGITELKGYDSSCCNIVIQYFYTFQNDRHSQNSYYFSPYEDITQLLTTCPTLYILYPWHPLEKEIATHSSVLAWRIPQTEEPGRLQSMAS